MQNLKLAIRRLRSSPFVTTVAVVSLALGIGANAAIFSIFNEMLLRPLPVVDPGQLVNLEAPGPKPGSQSCGNAGGCDEVFSYPMFRDLESQQTVLTGMAAHVGFGANLSFNNETTDGSGLLVSGSYFGVLGVQPVHGRLINQSDEPSIGEAPVVVLSHAYWRNSFNADPSVVGRPLVVNGQPMTIIGVTPEDFRGTTLGTRPQVYVPITLRGRLVQGFDAFENRRSYWAYLFGRLEPGVTIDQARAALGAQYRAIVNDVEAPLQSGMSDATMARFREKPILLEPGQRGQSSADDGAASPLVMLMAVTGVVLLIACANIANLLLARSAARSTEMAIRLSIGASRRALVGQLLTESLVLAAMGGLAGMLVARWTIGGIMAMMPPQIAESLEFGLDGRALLFTAVVALTTGFLFGLFPAIHSSRPNLLATIKGSAGQPAGSRSAAFFRVALATTQIAMSMALLGTAGLFVRSLMNLSTVDLGVSVDRVVTFSLSPQRNGYSQERTRALYARLEEELAAAPGVEGVTASLVPLIAGSSWGSNVSVEGFEAGPDIDTNSRYNEVAPDYFRTLGMPLLDGREFTMADRTGTPGVAVVNEAFARKFNLGRAVVGRRMEVGNSGALDLEIVGLVKDARYSDVKDEVPPVFFLPYRQTERVGSLNFYVRSAGTTDQIMTSIMPTVKRLDPNLPIENLRSMPEQIRQNVFQDRIVSTLSAAFAGLATLLAAVGLYGVLAYTVAQRTREFGLRLALGAAPSRVLALVMKRVGLMTLVGSVVGIGLAAGAGFGIRSELYQLEWNDPVVLGSAAVVLVGVALLAGFIPAYRASRVDPMRALRYE
jgi:predicted permease